MSSISKLFLLVGISFLIYGYLCRTIGLDFFWESKSIGWYLIFIGAIFFFYNRIRNSNNEKRKATIDKIGLGVFSFILLIQTILIMVIPNTEAYSVTKEYLRNDTIIRNEVGDINGFGLIPIGSIQKTIDSNGEYGNATIVLTVKGDKAYKDITVYVVKHANNPNWKVEGIE
jgi:hypothetical protein